MQRIAIAFAFLAALMCLLAACGGGGGSGGDPGNLYAGVYQGTFTRAVDSVLLVVVSADGTTEAVVSDADGVVVEGTGTTDEDGNISVVMNGTLAETTLTGAFSRAPGLDGNLSGGINGSVQLDKSGSGANPYAGKFKVQYSGSSTGDFKLTIDSTGRVFKTTGTSSTRVGTISSTGTITFEGEGLALLPAGTSKFDGKLFLNSTSAGGSGTWQDTGTSSVQGLWNAIPDLGEGPPVFNEITEIKSISGFDYITILGVSPNKHMAGFSGSTPAYWSDPNAVPIALSHPAGTTISWPTDVNESGTVTGYSYNQDGLISSKAVVWLNGSSSPTELKYPDEYVAGIANSINEDGVIVGLIRKANGTTRPAIWQNSGAIAIIPPEGDGHAISNAGVMLCAANNGYLPTIASQEVIALTPPPGYGPNSNLNMGENGIIVGTSESIADQSMQPVFWSPLLYGAQSMATFGGFAEVIPTTASNSGAFAGRGKAEGSNINQAIYWKNANEIGLLDDIVANNYIFFQGGQYFFADGSLIAYGKDLDGFPKVVWLKP